MKYLVTITNTETHGQASFEVDETLGQLADVFGDKITRPGPSPPIDSATQSLGGFSGQYPRVARGFLIVWTEKQTGVVRNSRIATIEEALDLLKTGLSPRGESMTNAQLYLAMSPAQPE